MICISSSGRAISRAANASMCTGRRSFRTPHLFALHRELPVASYTRETEQL